VRCDLFQYSHLYTDCRHILRLIQSRGLFVPIVTVIVIVVIKIVIITITVVTVNNLTVIIFFISVANSGAGSKLGLVW